MQGQGALHAVHRDPGAGRPPPHAGALQPAEQRARSRYKGLHLHLLVRPVLPAVAAPHAADLLCWSLSRMSTMTGMTLMMGTPGF